MIESERELREKSELAGSLIQEIADYVRANPAQERRGRLRFPRGFIKPAAEIRRRLNFIPDETLKRNVSYALMTHEVLRWVAFSTDLAGQAHEMIVKEAVCLLGSIAESITIFPDEHGLGRGSSYKKRIARLREIDVIDARSERRLLWLWDKRNQEHLYDVPFREFEHYSKTDWYKSVRAYASLRADLTKWRCPQV